MALDLPVSLSPSKVSAFRDCALAFRLSAIDKLPEPPSPAAVKGTLVHRALEHLFVRDPSERTAEQLVDDFALAASEIRLDEEFLELGLGEADEKKFFSTANRLAENLFEMEDPTSIQPIGLELMLETKINGLHLRGIIDRLEMTKDGEFIVTDYKSGRSPSEAYAQGRLGGVTFYALLCEELFGKLPAKIQLLFLGDSTSIVTIPTEQSTQGLRNRISALWSAIEMACEREDFRPKPSPLCSYCGFHAYCPAQGGDLSLIPKPEPKTAPVPVQLTAG